MEFIDRCNLFSGDSDERGSFLLELFDGIAHNDGVEPEFKIVEALKCCEDYLKRAETTDT